MTLFSALLLAACSGSTIDTSDTGKPADSGADTSSGLVAPDIVINEVLAANATINTDGAGEYDDWVELYNAGDSIVQLDGFTLTDDDADPKQYQLPTGLGIAPGDFLLIWCDAQPDQQTGSELHTAFKLNKKKDGLWLYYYEGDKRAQADAVDWKDNQVDDISAARIPDGSVDWQLTNRPTPDAANQANQDDTGG